MMSESPQRTLGPAIREFFGVPFRKQTYRHLAYLVLALPLGLVYFTGVTIGLSTGIGLAVTLVGIPVVILTLIAGVGAAGFEAKLTEWLLDVQVNPPRSLHAFSRNYSSLDDVVLALKELVTTPTTWTGILLLPLKLAFGVIAFSALMVAGTLSWTLILAPVYYELPGFTYTIGPYLVDSIGKAVALSGAGIFVTLIALHILNGLAKFGGFTTAALLGTESGQPNQEPLDIEE